MSDDLPEPELPANLRFLRVLVTTLTATMIIGLIIIIALLVIRFRPAPEASVALPDSVVLPDGARAAAFTQGTDWFAVVTEDDLILIYDKGTGTLRQTVEITR